MGKKTYTITKDEYEAIRIHSFNLYSAVEEMMEDFQILYKNLEKIKNREDKKSKLEYLNAYKNK